MSIDIYTMGQILLPAQKPSQTACSPRSPRRPESTFSSVVTVNAVDGGDRRRRNPRDERCGSGCSQQNAAHFPDRALLPGPRFRAREAPAGRPCTGTADICLADALVGESSPPCHEKCNQRRLIEAVACDGVGCRPVPKRRAPVRRTARLCGRYSNNHRSRWRPATDRLRHSPRRPVACPLPWKYTRDSRARCETTRAQHLPNDGQRALDAALA